MSRNIRRTTALSAATGTAVLVSLASAGGASAAIAGAQPSAFTNRPNLVSVNVSGNVATFNFDQAVNLQNAAGFTVGGYRAGQAVTQPVTQVTAGSGTNANTVRVIYAAPSSSEAPDLDSVTYGTVATNAVTGNGTFGNGNLQDSAPTFGAQGESGTAGRTTAPDLQGITVDEDANRILFTFDQKLSPTAPAAGGFSFTNANGVTVLGAAGGGNGAVTVSDFEVSVPFNGNDVSTAVSAGVNGAAVTSRTPNNGNGRANFPSDAVVSGTNGTSVAPRLVSANLITNTGQIDYKFDRAVTSPAIANFVSGLANGVPVPATAATVIGDGTVVRAAFPANGQRIESVVYASALPGAVQGAQSGIQSTVGGVGVGGNAGAKSAGYTTAPDATGVTFNDATGEVAVTYDSRLASVPNAANYALFNGTGTQIVAATPATIQFDQSSSPTQTVVRIQFTPDQVKIANTLVLSPGAALGTIGTAAQGGQNIIQTLSPDTRVSTFAGFAASKKSLTLKAAKTQVDPNSALAKAYKPTKSKKQAAANAKVIAKALSSASARKKLAPTVKVKRTSVKKAAR